MRVLISTSETQGQRSDDYHWTCDGELVRLPLAECPDAECGCSRGFAGLASRRATTTAVVEERPDLDVSGLGELLRQDVLDGIGPGGLPLTDEELDEIDEETEEELHLLQHITSHFPPGTVIERSGSVLRARRSPDRTPADP
jgi:hypothetical protein